MNEPMGSAEAEQEAGRAVTDDNLTPEQREAIVYVDGILQGLAKRLLSRPPEATGLEMVRRTLAEAFPFLQEYDDDLDEWIAEEDRKNPGFRKAVEAEVEQLMRGHEERKG